MESELAKSVIERVKLWREERGLSQEQYAENAGMDPKHYQHVEALRKTDFRISTLEKLAKGCGVEAWELLQPNFAVAETKQAKYESSPAPRPRCLIGFVRSGGLRPSERILATVEFASYLLDLAAKRTVRKAIKD